MNHQKFAAIHYALIITAFLVAVLVILDGISGQPLGERANAPSASFDRHWILSATPD